MFTEAECDAMDAHRERMKELSPLDEPPIGCDDCGSLAHQQCPPAVVAHACDIGTYDNGVYTDCAYEAGHVGRCSGAKEIY